MKRYLRKLANSFVGIGTRRFIDITDGGKYGKKNVKGDLISERHAQLYIEYNVKGELTIYLHGDTRTTRDVSFMRLNTAHWVYLTGSDHEIAAYNKQHEKQTRAKGRDKYNARRAVDGKPGQIFPFTKEVNK